MNILLWLSPVLFIIAISVKPASVEISKLNEKRDFSETNGRNFGFFLLKSNKIQVLKVRSNNIKQQA